MRIPKGESELISVNAAIDSRTPLGGRGGWSRPRETPKVVGDRAEEIARRYIEERVGGASDIVWRAKIGERPGWDIDYLDDRGETICVEVKGSTSAKFSRFELTENERKAAIDRGNRYWLYLVGSCMSERPSIKCIQDPAQFFGDGVDLQPTQYRATFTKSLAEMSDGGD